MNEHERLVKELEQIIMENPEICSLLLPEAERLLEMEQK